MRTHDEIMAALPPERRARIVARSDELKRDHLLRELREAVSKTQQQSSPQDATQRTATHG